MAYASFVVHVNEPHPVANLWATQPAAQALPDGIWLALPPDFADDDEELHGHS